VDIPADGAAPTFSSGTIKETEYQIYTSGVIKTSADPTSTGGVLIDNTGLGAYDSTGTLKTKINADGSMILYSSVSTGKRIEINPSNDNEIHFYGDRGDTTVEELATIGIKASGPDYVIGYFGSSASLRTAIYAEAGGNSPAATFKSSSGLALDVQSTRMDSGNIVSINGTASNSPGALYAVLGSNGQSSAASVIHGRFGSADTIGTGGPFGVYGASENTGILGAGRAAGSAGVYGYGGNGAGGLADGVRGKSGWGGGYGGVFEGQGSGKAALRIVPSSSASAPTHSADIGALHVTSAGVLYINTSGSTTWQKVGAQ